MSPKQIKESELCAFENWLHENSGRISGDCDEVQRKWEESYEYREWCDSINQIETKEPK